MMSDQRITPCLWFNFNAEEAVAHYCAIFADARIEKVAHYGPCQPGPEGAVMTILFSIEGQSFLALNGGPQFPFTSAISLVVDCDTQAEVDDYWERLSAGGAKGPCGWLTDKFGVSWQIVPRALPELLTSGGAEQANRVMKAVLAMSKLDIAVVRRAAGPN
ncbi:MAG: VOC family protein [Roseiarcus sp.]|jgi:predicted 3-demethylubiquinone-9 3-methyltransferase (glyoxalase superfamily)